MEATQLQQAQTIEIQTKILEKLVGNQTKNKDVITNESPNEEDLSNRSKGYFLLFF